MTLKTFRTLDLLRSLPAAILILAVFAQALVPTGWMPNLQGTGDGVVVLCSSPGGSADDQSPVPPDDQRMGQTCAHGANILANPPDSLTLVAAWDVGYSKSWPRDTIFFTISQVGPPFGSRAPPTRA